MGYFLRSISRDLTILDILTGHKILIKKPLIRLTFSSFGPETVQVLK